MIADLLLRLLGEEPAAYPHSIDKWAVISADFVDTIVPIVITLLFLSPFLLIKLRKKPFTAANFLLSLAIGSLFAYGAWLLNEWSYGYGQAVIFREIYGNEPWF